MKKGIDELSYTIIGDFVRGECVKGHSWEGSPYRGGIGV